MRFVLNRDGDQVTRDQVEGHAEEEYDEEEEPHVGGGDKNPYYSFSPSQLLSSLS